MAFVKIIIDEAIFMEIIKFQDSQQFYQRVKNYLLNQEATHCLLLFVSKTLSTSQPKEVNLPYLAIVENQQEIVAIGIRTPPRPLLISQSTDLEAVKILLAKVISLGFKRDTKPIN